MINNKTLWYNMLLRRKVIKECDGCGASIGADAGTGGVSFPMTTLNNVNGMGNPIPPSSEHLGSGDNFGNIISKPATKKAVRYKLRRKK